MKTIRWAALFYAAFMVLTPLSALAEERPADNMKILLEKVRADKKLVIATNMGLSVSEAETFWPVYERYQKSLAESRGRATKVIESYARNYKAMTDETAKGLMDEWLAIQADRLKFQRSYLSELRKGLPEVKVIRYFQLENKIDAVLRYVLAEIIPLIQLQPEPAPRTSTKKF